MDLRHVFLIAISMATALGITECPFSLLQNVTMASLDDRCYAFFTQHLQEPARATTLCNGYGGTLAMPKTKRINDFLAGVLKNQLNFVNDTMAWIGLHYYDQEFKFRWSDGSVEPYPGGFSAFDAPAGTSLRDLIPPDYDCVGLTGTGSWIMHQCVTVDFYIASIKPARKAFICEFS